MRQSLIRLLLVAVFALIFIFLTKRPDALLLAFVCAWILEGVVAAAINKP